jgi:hypothetical protein
VLTILDLRVFLDCHATCGIKCCFSFDRILVGAVLFHAVYKL